MKTNIIIILLLVISVVGFVFWIGFNLNPGSYPFAEKYKLNFSETELRNAIIKFKNKNTEYNVPKVSINNQGEWDLLDKSSNDGKRYIIYFYYKKENKIILTWIRPEGLDKATFAFVGVNDGLNIGNWKYINKDFEGSENAKEKKKFEKIILENVMKLVSEKD